MNYHTADRPRCMLRGEFYVSHHQQQQQQQQSQKRRNFRKIDYYSVNDDFDDNDWYWNMNRQSTNYNGSAISSKGSHYSQNKRHSKSHSGRNSNAPSDRSSSSGFQSFFRWFKRDDKSQRNSKDIRYPRELTSSTDTLEYDYDRRAPPFQYNSKKPRAYDVIETPPTSHRLSYAFSQSSSCDSVFSTASSFAFVPPIKYLLNRNQKQNDRKIHDSPYTESYHKRVKARDHFREIDKNTEITLRKKYHLFGESSDIESINNNNNNVLATNQNHYQRSNRSLPNTKRISQESNNLPDIQDANVVNKHRRTSSDTSKDKQAGAFVHVKHKRKAPLPPSSSSTGNTIRNSTPKTNRKKRQAPAPPVRENNAVSTTNILKDKDIRAIVEGSSVQESKPEKTHISNSPKMDHKKYVSPYLKIREDKKLTDEQKRFLLEQVSKSHRKNENQEAVEGNNTFRIEKGQLINQRAESPTRDEKEKVYAPSSPISPRPWYKRSSNNNNNTNHKETIPFKKEVFLRTMEKERKKKKDEKDLPEVIYSRNSFFESASKFNIFARLTEDSAKKKEKENEKRRSQIGIPNISELDREAAEIIHQRESRNILQNTIENFPNAAVDEDEETKTAKDLIIKFESNSSNINRVTINNGIVGREEFFGFPKKDINESMRKAKIEDSTEVKGNENLPPMKTKIPISSVNRETSSLLGLWTCAFCTFENPNWKIICENCEKIKPYEKRYCANNGNVNNKQTTSTPPSSRKFSYHNGENDHPWEKKTELVMKYFQPPPHKIGELSKSASETFIVNSLMKKSPSPTRRFMGSPKLPPRKFSTDKQESKIEAIAEESNENDKVNNAILNPIKKFYPPLDSQKNEKEKTPDLNEVRLARLARFNTSLDLKKNQTDAERMNVTVNRKQSPEKTFSDKLDFSDPISLEKEKERLREKIRAMNAKALAEKYPIIEKSVSDIEETNENALPPQPELLQPNISESSKLGAIKKVLKKPLVVLQQEKLENEAVALEEKIINKESKTQDLKMQDKPEKVSTSVQVEFKIRKKSEDLVPTTVVELVDENKKAKEINHEVVEVPSVTIRLPSNTNTIAINRIIRNLENAIAAGNHDDAAKLAKDLAKLKVPLSVTRQKDRPKSEIDLENSKVKAWLSIKENFREMEVNSYEISSAMTVDELKEQITKDYYILKENQNIIINGIACDDGKRQLSELGVKIENGVKINVNAKTSDKKKKIKREDSESDDEKQNEKVGVKKENVKKENQKPMMIEERDWECSLCTLINPPTRQQCLVCSTLKPVSNKISKLDEVEYHFKVNEDLRKFFEIDKVDLRQRNGGKNDLNRQSVNRKSSDLLNILVDDKKLEPLSKQNDNVILPSTTASATPNINPNITRNKYRGVDNFNPYKSYLFPNIITTSNEIRKPIITNVIYKSSQKLLKDSSSNIAAQKSHYQELVNLEVSDIALNSEKFECSICFLEIKPKDGVCIRDCLHTFCKLCLQKHITYNNEEAEVKCPFINDMYSCQSFLQEREIRGLVSKEEYEKHLSKSVRLAENKIKNAFHCKTPNCKGWCIVDGDTNNFKCSVCTIVNCINCSAIHDGLNCKQYQDHLSKDSDVESANQTKKLLQELIDKDEAMNCPTCHIFLLKKWGCDWLKCSFCKTEICWITKQQRWGPNGKGDISAGCKCGVNGKKCSPKCTYCH